jgi:hypothetical protein
LFRWLLAVLKDRSNPQLRRVDRIPSLRSEQATQSLRRMRLPLPFVPGGDNLLRGWLHFGRNEYLSNSNFGKS